MKYRDTGVDIDRAERLVDRIRELARKAPRKGVIGEIGLFSGAMLFPGSDYREPVLVSGTDGVGTKILLAGILDRYGTIGIDLVAMSVNDIITCGAEPLFFLDYLSVGRISQERDAAIIEGIVEGCRRTPCALLGGETAEMPGVYGPGGFDLAGFAVGVVEKSRMITGETITGGDQVIGLASDGLHSNGFSLVRGVFGDHEISADPDGLGAELLKPTRIYAPAVRQVLKKFSVKGMAHITGGGLVDNLPRILPAGTGAFLDGDSWPRPAIFELIEKKGGVSQKEMFRTFNQGIGLVLVVPAGEAPGIVSCLREEAGEKAWPIGHVEAVKGTSTCVIR